MKTKVYWCVKSDDMIDDDGYTVSGEEYVLIDLVYVTKSQRGKGIGTKILKAAIEDIQKQHPDKTIKLVALPKEEGIDQEKLPSTSCWAATALA